MTELYVTNEEHTFRWMSIHYLHLRVAATATGALLAMSWTKPASALIVLTLRCDLVTESTDPYVE
jgi:hypothetical protein